MAAQVVGDDISIETPDGDGWKPADLQWDEKPLHIDFERTRRIVGTRQSRTIVVPAGNGSRTILIASAAATGIEFDVGAQALTNLDEACANSYDTLREEHTRWWHGFWSRTFVHISSADGVADFMERVRALHLYYAASASRGDVPAPQGDGLIFQTEGDIPRLGTQLWHWIVETMYRPLLAADAMDVCDPYFDMYARQLPECEKAAQQRWGVAGGAFFPETCPTDGPVVLAGRVRQGVSRILPRPQRQRHSFNTHPCSVPARVAAVLHKPVRPQQRDSWHETVHLHRPRRFHREQDCPPGLVALSLHRGSAVSSYQGLSPVAGHG